MKELPNLKELTDEAKEALIVKLWEELQKLQKQLEKKPKKTSKNSSLPPAKGFKAETDNPEEGSVSKRVGSIGREGGGRQLSENPDQTIKAIVKSCAECGKEIAESMQVYWNDTTNTTYHQSNQYVTRIERYGCKCEHCGQEQISNSTSKHGSRQSLWRSNRRPSNNDEIQSRD
ncbi:MULTISPECIES: hypothetical protein [Pseudanabaena]|uniref:Transposase IS66 n=2 Tax=Pseudanabaena TaxID=1152 RepID=L8MUQ1_9CYAN|nr:MULTISPECIES: hypothetical protein [Pseudanabaena]ELS30190.1 hypothetical protein Pse7429DRAFT_4724 [Pseudanabaena biceps PCC 7429]MDG3497522.1 hypothetical protein [Pseudanabaena catenata USMAC16]